LTPRHVTVGDGAMRCPLTLMLRFIAIQSCIALLQNSTSICSAFFAVSL